MYTLITHLTDKSDQVWILTDYLKEINGEIGTSFPTNFSNYREFYEEIQKEKPWYIDRAAALGSNYYVVSYSSLRLEIKIQMSDLDWSFSVWITDQSPDGVTYNRIVKIFYSSDDWSKEGRATLMGLPKPKWLIEKEPEKPVSKTVEFQIDYFGDRWCGMRNLYFELSSPLSYEDTCLLNKAIGENAITWKYEHDEKGALVRVSCTSLNPVAAALNITQVYFIPQGYTIVFKPIKVGVLY